MDFESEYDELMNRRFLYIFPNIDYKQVRFLCKKQYNHLFDLEKYKDCIDLEKDKVLILDLTIKQRIKSYQRIIDCYKRLEDNCNLTMWIYKLIDITEDNNDKADLYAYLYHLHNYIGYFQSAMNFYPNDSVTKKRLFIKFVCKLFDEENYSELLLNKHYLQEFYLNQEDEYLINMFIFSMKKMKVHADVGDLNIRYNFVPFC